MAAILNVTDASTTVAGWDKQNALREQQQNPTKTDPQKSNTIIKQLICQLNLLHQTLDLDIETSEE